MPSNHHAAMFGVIKSSEPSQTLEQETYIIYLPKPKQHRQPTDFEAGSKFTFMLQRYHRNPDTAAFEPVFPSEIALVLKVIRLRNKLGHSYSFPYLLDARPEVSLYTNVCQASTNDPILWMLSNNLRMTFRYNLDDGIGYLVHAGYDWPHIDDSSLIPLWQTAVNLQRDNPPT